MHCPVSLSVIKATGSRRTREALHPPLALDKTAVPIRQQSAYSESIKNASP